MNAEPGDVEIRLDASLCQGYGLCIAIAPEVFDVPGNSPVAVLLRSVGSAAEREVLEQAVRACPARAISLVPVA
jgi:ferredoxin